MRTIRNSIGTVVEIKGARILLNLDESMKSFVSSSYDGISEISQPSDLFAINAGTDLVICRVEEIFFAEPKNVDKTDKPLRQLYASAIGKISYENEKKVFDYQSWKLPSLGSKAYALSQEELELVITIGSGSNVLTLGMDAKTEQIKISVELNDFLARHVAVLGSTGQGKTNFISQVSQELVKKNENARIVIFDINGEYSTAFSEDIKKIAPHANIKITKIGKPPKSKNGNYLHIPYYALGRQGIIRLLIPSDKTQLPALRFALEHLAYVENSDEENAVWPVNKANILQKLRDDCASDSSAQYAYQGRELLIQHKKDNPDKTSNQWPSFQAIGCLCAEWSSLEERNGKWTRSAFNYSNVQPMIARINALISDSRFGEIINVSGGNDLCKNKKLDIRDSTQALIEKIFGNPKQEKGHWNVHIVDLSSVTSDLMPYVAGPLLEAYADQLFQRGPGKTHPTLLILEEAHNYLKHKINDDNGNLTLAYERLAKEGRKFNLSLMLSTQRPSELSPSVLSQCGTWCVMRLTNENDLRALHAATDSTDKASFIKVPSLMRGYAYIFGASVRVPQIIKTFLASPQPNSSDALFSTLWK